MRLRLLVLVALLASGCAHTPPNLSPAAQTAWKQHEIQKDLDLIRDLAQDANARVPPLISTNTARAVTLWHKSAIMLVHDAAQGWRLTVLAGLDELRTNLPAAEYQVIAVYVELAKTVLRSVQP